MEQTQEEIEEVKKRIRQQEIEFYGDHELNIKEFDFNFDVNDGEYELDVLQQEMMQFYIRNDPKFRQAFYTDYTGLFIQVLKDKARLREPVHISIMGNVRTFTDDNFIFTDNGWRKPNDLHDCREVLSYNFDTEKYEWKDFELAKRIRNPKERFFKITFSDNRTMTLGENHPIFTKDKGWKKAFSLYKDIEIPFFSNFEQKITRNNYSLELTRIIAFLLSCGHLNGSNFNYLDKRDGRTYKKQAYVISYVSSSHGNVNQLLDDFKKEFDIEMRYKKKRNENYKGIEVELANKKIFNILAQYIPIGKKSHKIEVPSWIFNATKTVHREFISTLFSGDGYISNFNHMPCAEYYSMSHKFTSQLQLILSQYGIISVVDKKKVKNNKTINRLRITGKKNVLAFIEFVGDMCNEKKNERIKNMKKRLIKQKVQKINRQFYIRNVEEVSIEKEYIYDIFVEDNSNFFLDGILTHNSGKSYGGISILAIMMALQGKLILPCHICANAYKFLERIQEMPLEETNNTTFLRDEDKQPFGVGSISKKAKIQDVANIVAKHNISTLSLCPIKFADSESHYGLRTIGRNFKNKTTKYLLYNMQESKNSMIPMGTVILPIFTKLLPDWYAQPLEKMYVKVKDDWIADEIEGKGQDVLSDLKRKTAEKFMRDPQFMGLTNKKLRKTYIQQVMGSEWTLGELEAVLSLTEMMRNGIRFDDEPREKIEITPKKIEQEKPAPMLFVDKDVKKELEEDDEE